MTTPVKLVAMFPGDMNSDPEGEAIRESVRQRILDDTGADVEILNGPLDMGEYQTKLNLMLAGGEQLDMIQVYSFNGMYQQDLCADITDAVAKYGKNITERWTVENMGQFVINERMYALPRMANAITHPTWVRGDWLKMYDLEIPKTIDDLNHVMQVFKENDPAGNGSTVVALFDSGHTDMVLMGAFMKGGGRVFLDDTDGRYKPAWMDPDYKNYLTQLNEWYQKGYVPKDTLTLNPGEQGELIQAGRVGISFLWYSRITINEQGLQVNFPDAYYERCVISGPKGLAMTANYVMNLPGSGGAGAINALVITSSCKNIDKAVEVINWGYIGDNFLTAWYGPDSFTCELTADGTYVATVPDSAPGGEYRVLFLGLPNDTRFVFEGDSAPQRHLSYLARPPYEVFMFENAKLPIDGTILYDSAAILEACPSYPDIERIRIEGHIAFITGERPLSQFDAFIGDLKANGVEDLIDEITRQNKSATE